MGRKTELEGDEEVQSDVTAERYLKVALQKANSNFKSVFGEKKIEETKHLGLPVSRVEEACRGSEHMMVDANCRDREGSLERGNRAKL